MGTLNASISIALQALMANQGALQTTTNNLANVNTEGYTRQRPVLMEELPVLSGSVAVGRGVRLDHIESLRDRVLELRLHQETQRQGGLNAFVTAMQSAELLFADNQSGIGGQMDAFFNSLTRLATDPANMSFRQGVVVAAGNLASAFQGTAQGLATLQKKLDLSVSQAVNDVNELTRQIASVNSEVARLEKLGQDTGAYEDQRTRLVRSLSELVDVSVVEGDDGLTLTTSSGAALVVGNQAFALAATPASDSALTHVYAQGRDITGELADGRLGGLLRARDHAIPSLLQSVDALAYNLASALNQAHRSGYDLAGNPGGDLFVPPAAPAGAAAALQLATNDPSRLAAGSDANAGSNGNVAQLLAVRNGPLLSGQTPTEFYANLVFTVGSELSNAQTEQEASDQLLRQLQDQRAAISGVSMDEESANLIRYQRAFEAAARVINVVDELTQVSLQLGKE